MARLVGSSLGKYRVVARLGRGGMAEVYKAYQPGLDRYVGIKVLHAHLVDDPDFIGRFEREALAIGKLRHPNIVQAVDFDRDGEIYFMAMEFIDGPTLKDEMKARRAANQPFSLEEVSRIFTALCSAIDYAHSRGMVHRDIKPANVMINDEGQVVLTDFGIARIMGATQYTQTGALSGTPAYMSPEQGQGERGDERSDIYSLGVMLYEMVTGAVPYDADTPFAVIMKHISEPLPLPTSVDPNIPNNVEAVIVKAMEKSADDRYQTAGEMARAMRDAVGLSADDNLRMTPLVIVAPPPKIQQIEHDTGPISSMQQRTVAGSQTTGGTTTVTQTGDMGATTVSAAPPAKKTPILLLLLGGAAVIIALIGVIGFLVLGSSPDSDTDPEATQDAIAQAIAGTSTAESAISATESAAANIEAEETAAAEATEAALMAPTETAAAATAAVERVAATEAAQATRDASLVGGLLATVQAATAEAEAIAASTAEALSAEADAATAEADAATAEALANATATPEPTETPTPAPPTNTPPPAVPTDTPTPAPPTDTPTPERPALSGKLAYSAEPPGTGKYDVFIVSMPDGEPIGKIEGARQPNFRADGKKILINGERSGFGENIFEASGTGSIEKPVSGSPTDLFPSYKPDGTTLSYSNPQLAFGSEGYQSYLFVQCGLKPPSQDVDKCAAIADFGIIIPPGAIGDIIGSNPVWTPSDQLAYKGCNTWQGGGSCGMFMVGSWAVKRTSNGELPRKLVDGSSVTPTDAKDGKIAFHSRETGDWEAYVVSEDGSGVVNLSNSPSSLDGIPTISPDGQWVAFASNRSGGWAVYVVPISGGEAQKLFDFPSANPWGGGDREWINERMSWAP